MHSSRVRVAVLAATTAVVLSGCSADEGDAGDAVTSSSTSAEPTGPPVPTGPFGPACAGVPAEGDASFAGIADDPFVVAASSQPALSRLVEAVTAASLTDTLNGTSDLTVLAPVNGAFDALPPEDAAVLLGASAPLTRLLTHHVIAGRLGPGELAGTHTTLAADQVTITGSGESFTIAGSLTGTPATVVCGNVTTANATVYLVDQVLAPAG